LFVEFVIAKQQQDDQHNRDISHAWHVAAFSRQDKLQPLKKFLRERAAPEGHTSVDKERALMHQLSALIGAPMRKTRLIRKPAA
jgi:hypothetical protein